VTPKIPVTNDDPGDTVSFGMLSALLEFFVTWGSEEEEDGIFVASSYSEEEVHNLCE
jgi:hypothetical protein